VPRALCAPFDHPERERSLDAPSDHCERSLDIGCRSPIVDDHTDGAIAHECTQRLKHRLMILLGRAHHALQPVDATKPDHDRVFVAEVLETLRHLLADEQGTRCFKISLRLFVGRLQTATGDKQRLLCPVVDHPGTNQHRNAP
jgi:hypothetical protein